MTIVHLIKDGMFVRHILDVSEAAAPGENVFRVFGKPRVDSRLRQNEGVVPVGTRYFRGRRERARILGSCSAILVHWMSRPAAEVIRHAPSHVAVAWCGWGGDYYRFGRDASDYDEDHVEEIVRPEKRSLSGRLRRLIRGEPPTVPPEIARVASRIDFMCIRETEGQFRALHLQDMLPGLSPVLRPNFQYYSLEQSFAPGPATMTGPDILLGNSATPSNRHHEAMEALARLDLTGRKVVIPLSYGERRYGDFVEAASRRLLGEAAMPLREWMPIADYNAVLGNCGVVLMNHLRGQGMGNIATGLFKGARVLLRDENPYLEYYRERGAVIGTFRPADITASHLAPLADDARARNRRIIEDLWSFDACVRHVRNLFDEFENLTARRRVST